MLDLLLWLPMLNISVNTITMEATEKLAIPGAPGLVLITIIVIPVIVLVLASMFGSSRTLRIPGLLIGSLILLIGAMISVFAVSSILLGFIIPQ